MIELIPYKAEHAIEIINSQCCEPCLKVTGLSERWAKAKEGPVSKTGIYEGKIVGCGGIEICWEGMAQAWILFVSDIINYHIDPRIVKRQLDAWIEEYKLVRVQAPMRANFKKGLRYARFLGFKDEHALLKKYYPDGADALMYAIVGE